MSELVPGDKCCECVYCGKRFTDDLSVFCLIPDRPAVENVCYCVCEDCKEKYKKTPKAASKIGVREIKKPSVRKERP